MSSYIIMNHKKETLDKTNKFSNRKPFTFKSKAEARSHAKIVQIEKSTGLINYKIKTLKEEI